MKHNFNEPWEEVKELKFKELRTMMDIGWNVDLEKCKSIEKVLGELVDDIFKEKTPSEEEKQFVRNACKSISESLQRDCTVKEI